MRLNPDCIRDILLYVEANSGYTFGAEIKYPIKVTYFDFSNTQDEEPDSEASDPIFQEYNEDTLFYHIDYCHKSGLIDEPQYLATYHARIPKLTPYGHELLGQIRDDKNWRKVKTGLTAVRNYSLQAISSIASGVTNGAVAAYIASLK